MFFQGDAQMGFVEICLGDVPFNRDIEGWFELRYKDRLPCPQLCK